MSDNPDKNRLKSSCNFLPLVCQNIPHRYEAPPSEQSINPGPYSVSDDSRQLRSESYRLDLSQMGVVKFSNYLIFKGNSHISMCKTYIKASESINIGSPFICQNKPFVGTKKPLVIPLIGLNVPIIRYCGFTLIELIIALTVLGVLVSLAAPGMQKFLSSNRLSAQVNDLIADINLVRSEAIKRNTTAGLCVTAAGGSSCVASGNWANGWMVYAVVGGVDTQIKTHEPLGKNTLSGPADKVIYDRNGIMTSPTSGSLAFTLCDPKSKRTRIVTLTTTGRPAISEGGC